MIKVLLADDHAFVREALVDLFTASGDVSVVAECGDGDEVVPAVDATQPDVILLDASMPQRRANCSPPTPGPASCCSRGR